MVQVTTSMNLDKPSVAIAACTGFPLWYRRQFPFSMDISLCCNIYGKQLVKA